MLSLLGLLMACFMLLPYRFCKVRSHIRCLRSRPITFACAWCGDTVTLWAFPGPPIRYCSEECKIDARREQVRQANQRRRERCRVGQPSKSRGRPRTALSLDCDLVNVDDTT